MSEVHRCTAACILLHGSNGDLKGLVMVLPVPVLSYTSYNSPAHVPQPSEPKASSQPSPENILSSALPCLSLCGIPVIVERNKLRLSYLHIHTQKVTLHCSLAFPEIGDDSCATCDGLILVLCQALNN